MKVLALDTAALSPSAALVREGRVAAIAGAAAKRGSSEQVLALVEQVLGLAGLRAAELDAVAVSRGPGSLTGLRVGIGTARGIAIGAGKPLLGISSLRAIAAELGEGPAVLALVGAGRGEIYGCLFEPGTLAVQGSVVSWPRPLGPERVARPEDFAAATGSRTIRLAGPGASGYREAMQVAAVSPSAGEEILAGAIGLLAWGHLATGAPRGDTDPSPRYLRREQGPVRFEG